MSRHPIGRAVAALRRADGLLQADLARRAGVSQTTVSSIERGDVTRMQFGLIERVAAGVGIGAQIVALGRGAELDRLIDREHARLVEWVAGELRRAGWEVTLEFAFNRYGDRGSVDVLAWHGETRTLLIIEVKSALTDLQAMFRALAVKRRVVPAAFGAEHRVEVADSGVILVVAATGRNRRVVGGHAESFDLTFPARWREIRDWLGRPSGPISGLWFPKTARGGPASPGSHRSRTSAARGGS